jgi:hypothetical protein
MSNSVANSTPPNNAGPLGGIRRYFRILSVRRRVPDSCTKGSHSGLPSTGNYMFLCPAKSEIQRCFPPEPPFQVGSLSPDWLRGPQNVGCGADRPLSDSECSPLIWRFSRNRILRHSHDWWASPTATPKSTGWHGMTRPPSYSSMRWVFYQFFWCREEKR